MPDLRTSTAMNHPARPSRAWPRLLAWGLIAWVLSAVFMLYARPDFWVDMANQLWSCF